MNIFFPTTYFEESEKENDELFRIYAGNPVAAILTTVSGFLVSPESTVYTKQDDTLESIFFSASDNDRVIDVERKLEEFESTYGMSSGDFFFKWRGDRTMDKPELNKWGNLYQYYTYVKER